MAEQRECLKADLMVVQLELRWDFLLAEIKGKKKAWMKETSWRASPWVVLAVEMVQQLELLMEERWDVEKGKCWAC
jgi:hypothetical protein